MEKIKELYAEHKKYVIALGGVIVFSTYMLWPEGSAVDPAEDAIAAQLAAVQAENAEIVPRPEYREIDRNGIAIGNSGGGGAPGSFDSSIIALQGIYAGFGTKAEGNTQYTVAFLEDVENDEVLGYTLDLRELDGRYSIQVLEQFEIGQQVTAYGRWSGDEGLFETLSFDLGQ